jgi:uncharacterized RDD family membrane protein YckC
MKEADSLPVAGVGRRIAAMVYDALLLLALLFVATALFLPLTHGEYIESGGPLLTNIYRLALLAVWIAFYGLFWTRSGQTLGMLAWRLKLVHESGRSITWRDVIVRLGAGILSLLPVGLGFLWVWVDGDGLAWHDRLSHTRPVVLPKKRKK